MSAPSKRPSSKRPPPSSTADTSPGAGSSRLVQSQLPDDQQHPSPSTPPITPPSLSDASITTPITREAFKLLVRKGPVPLALDVVSPDPLLEGGIGDYSVVPGPALGKGKFSVVYKAIRADKKNGENTVYAIKATPLYPHHPLIAQRLLREPLLLAQLPPHPNLVKVFETVKTDGHFYLVEEFLQASIPLDQLCSQSSNKRLPVTLVWHILCQLVSVVRDSIHAGSVAHRDIKPENVLIDPSTGHVTIIDLGLATYCSLTSPRLTTCCGSPAFHSPEVVHALQKPPGEVSYFGPELDIWTIGLTILRCWTGRRYPVGTNHTALSVMRGRVEDALAALPIAIEGEDRRLGKKLKEVLKGFLDMDGRKRMARFVAFDVGDEVKRTVAAFEKTRDFKQTTFAIAPPKHTLPLYLHPFPISPDTSSPDISLSSQTFDAPLCPDDATMLLLNPTGQSETAIISFLKFALRSHNILYHCQSVSLAPSLPIHPSSIDTFTPPDSASLPIDVLQCIADLPPPPPPPQPTAAPAIKRPFFPSFFRSQSARSLSTPPTSLSPPTPNPSSKRSQSGTRRDESKKTYRSLTFSLAVTFSPPEVSAALAQEKRRRRSRSKMGRSRDSSRAPPASLSSGEGTGLGGESSRNSSRNRRVVGVSQPSSRASSRHPDSRASSRVRNSSSAETSATEGSSSNAAASQSTSSGRHRISSLSSTTSLSTLASVNSPASSSQALSSPSIDGDEDVPPTFRSLSRAGSSRRNETVRPHSRIRSLTAATQQPKSENSTPPLELQVRPSLHHRQSASRLASDQPLPEPWVRIHLSDPRALPVVKAALDICLAANGPYPPAVDSSRHRTCSSTASSPLIPASPLVPSSPALSIRRVPVGEDIEEEEPRRGRPEGRSAYSWGSQSSAGESKPKTRKPNSSKSSSVRQQLQDDESTPIPTPRPSSSPAKLLTIQTRSSPSVNRSLSSRAPYYRSVDSASSSGNEYEADRSSFASPPPLPLTPRGLWPTTPGGTAAALLGGFFEAIGLGGGPGTPVVDGSGGHQDVRRGSLGEGLGITGADLVSRRENGNGQLGHAGRMPGFERSKSSGSIPWDR